MINKAEIIKSSVEAESFWQSELTDFKPIFNTKGWSKGTICPFNEHENDVKQGGFSVSRDGGYICRKCGISGGDIIDFYMSLNSLDFLTACNCIARDFNVVFPNQEYTKVIAGEVGNIIPKSKSRRFCELKFPFYMCFLSEKNKRSFIKSVQLQKNLDFRERIRVETFNLVVSLYGKPQGKRFSQKWFKKSFDALLFMHKSRVWGHDCTNGYYAKHHGVLKHKDDSFFMSPEIFSDDEVSYGRYLAFCLIK